MESIWFGGSKKKKKTKLMLHKKMFVFRSLILLLTFCSIDSTGQQYGSAGIQWYIAAPLVCGGVKKKVGYICRKVVITELVEVEDALYGSTHPYIRIDIRIQ